MTQKTKTKLKPLLDRVIAQRLESEETVKGGIIIPDSAKKKQEMAKIIAIGPGKVGDNNELIKMPVTLGDVILMDKYAGQEITIDDQEYIIVKSDDIIAIVE
ncbi:MAG: 10 kDa chaperonin [Candidatus Anoxychlamydiales bacterium]|nr:10 kDa chaperonin [Candidatus Anoxychlamydiales bacterium]